MGSKGGLNGKGQEVEVHVVYAKHLLVKKKRMLLLQLGLDYEKRKLKLRRLLKRDKEPDENSWKLREQRKSDVRTSGVWMLVLKQKDKKNIDFRKKDGERRRRGRQVLRLKEELKLSAERSRRLRN